MPLSTINSNSIANGTVVASDILDGTISTSKLVAANIAGDRIAANTLSNTVFQTGSVENYLNAQSGGSLSGRNRIINGAMMIDQRNAGSSITPTDNQYSLDRWHTQVAQTAKLSIQKMDSANSSATGYESGSAPAGFSNSLKVTSLSSYSVVTGDYFAVDQCIEAFNLIDLNWGTANAKSVTLSFWVKSSLTGTFGGAIANGTFNRSYPFTYTIVAANTWEKKIITIPGDTSGTYGTTNGRGAYIQFGLGSGSTYSGTAGSWAATAYITSTGATSVVGTNAATWYLTGVQLEAGSQATPFETRQYGAELQLCQRYYEKWTGIASDTFGLTTAYVYNGNAIYGRHFYLVEKRAAPTITFSSTGNTLLECYATGPGSGLSYSGTISAEIVNTKSFAWNQPVSGISGGTAIMAGIRPNQSFQFSAEL